MRYRVLVVDDDPSVRWLVAFLIGDDDHLSLAGTAANGQEAVDLVRQGCPDAIVCDLNMPVMDGLQAVPLLRRACPDCFIVVYTSDPDAASAARRAGADVVVDKAVGPLALLRTVVAFCRSRNEPPANEPPDT